MFFSLNAIIRLNHMHLSSARKFQAGMEVEVKASKLSLVLYSFCPITGLKKHEQ